MATPDMAHRTYWVRCDKCGMHHSSIFEEETLRIITEHPHTEFRTAGTVKYPGQPVENVVWPTKDGKHSI